MSLARHKTVYSRACIFTRIVKVQSNEIRTENPSGVPWKDLAGIRQKVFTLPADGSLSRWHRWVTEEQDETKNKGNGAIG
ncbi:hypothetical protein ANTPLA_LOCUS3982 [Anthophora plagiata]